MNRLERAVFPLDELRVQGDGKRVTWYAAVFDDLSEDLGGFRERVGRRAFTKTLQEQDVRALFNHDPNMILGRTSAGTLDLHVDLHGLKASVEAPDTQWARDLLVSVERGDVNGGSFGFSTISEAWPPQADGSLVRELREVKLYDVSLVTYPAYQATEGVAFRYAFDGIIEDLDDLVLPLLRRRAGAPLDAASRERYEASVRRLQNILEPEPEVNTHHSVPLELRRRRLQLLDIRGG